MWSFSLAENDPLSQDIDCSGDSVEDVFHVDSYGSDKMLIGCFAIDTAATRTIMQTKSNSLLADRRKSTALMRAFAGNATRMADTEGTAHLCIVDPNDSSKLSPVSINATTIEKANSNLLSGKDMIQNLGFTLILDGDTVNGFYKFSKPPTIVDNRLKTSQIIQEIPATYDPERRMWLVYYVMAKSPEAAREAALNCHSLLPSKLDRSHRVMMATDKIDPWLNIFGEHGGIYSVTTEDDDSLFTEKVYTANKMVSALEDIFQAKAPMDSAILKLPDPNILKTSAKAHTEAAEDEGDTVFHDEDNDPIPEENERLLRADQTQFWLDSESILVPTNRAADKQLTAMQRHCKNGHVGYMAGCLICNQLKGSLRRVYSQATPIYDVVIGRTWSFDSIYWSHRSRHGNKYTVAGRESHAGYPAGAHFPNRQTEVCMDTMEQLIVSIRTDPNLGPNNFIETIFLDPAGEWGPDNTKAMERFKALHIHVIHKPTATDKRQMALGEGTIRMLVHTAKAIMLETRLETEWFEEAFDHAVYLRRLTCMSRNASKDGEGPRPLQELSRNRISTRECDKWLHYSQNPGTVCIVQIPHGPLNSNVGELSKVRWARVVSMRGDTVIFECPETRRRFSSKNYVALTLPKGRSAYDFLGIPSPSLPKACLPRNGDSETNKLKCIVQLGEVFKPQNGILRAPVELAVHAGHFKAAKVIVVDAENRVLTPDGDDKFLAPTQTKITFTVDPTSSTPVHGDESESRQMGYLRYHPEYFIGKTIYQYFEEPTPGVYEGLVVKLHTDDRRLENESYQWQVKFGTDDPFDYDENDMEKYCILKIDGTPDKPADRPRDGTDSEDEIYEPEVLNSREANTEISWTSTLDRETFIELCDRMHLAADLRPDYLKWIRDKFKRGNRKEFKDDPSAIYFPNPLNKKNKTYRFDAGLKFPTPEGTEWTSYLERTAAVLVDAIDSVETIRELTDGAFHEVVHHVLVDYSEYKEAYNEGEAIDRVLQHISIAELAGIAKVEHINYSKADSDRYTDTATGLPIAPKALAKVLGRPDQAKWDEVIVKEMKGLDDMGIFEHNLTRKQLDERGITPAKTIVGMRMLLDVKLKPDGSFDKMKARNVIQGHKGYVQQGVHYSAVFAAAPSIPASRVIQAIGVRMGYHRWTQDMCQAYLHGEVTAEEALPVRYPKGLERFGYGGTNEQGDELFGLLVGNLYGNPPAGRYWARRRDKWIKTYPGWKCTPMLYEPCIFKLEMRGITYIVIHTDDVDGVSEDPRDAKDICDAFHKEFKIKMTDSRFMLGNMRDVSVIDGVTRLTISQPSYIEDMWNKFKVHRGNAKAPKEPFPYNFDISRIDKHSRQELPIDPVESRKVLEKGFRELVGGLLWPARNAYPAISFACSMLSRYMQTPTEDVFSAGIHTLHWLYEHRHEGIVFSSDGNMEPICFYDSAHMQDLSSHKSSYGFVITWMGGPIVYSSKRHTLVGLSSAEDEYMTLTHAYKWVMWLRNLLQEMGYPQLVAKPTLMLGDNAQADRWAREAMVTNGNRHIERDFHKIKEAVERNLIEPRKIKGEENTSDMFTKAVSREVTAHLHDMLRGAAPLPEIPVSPYTLSGHGGSSVYRTDPEHVRRRNKELAIAPKMSSPDEKPDAKHQGV